MMTPTWLSMGGSVFTFVQRPNFLLTLNRLMFWQSQFFLLIIHRARWWKSILSAQRKQAAGKVIRLYLTICRGWQSVFSHSLSWNSRWLIEHSLFSSNSHHKMNNIKGLLCDVIGLGNSFWDVINLIFFFQDIWSTYFTYRIRSSISYCAKKPSIKPLETSLGSFWSEAGLIPSCMHLLRSEGVPNK